MMCGGSLVIAMLPTYAQIGALAPALLLLARLFQGLSVGGEYGTSATYMSEVALKGRRGFFASFQYVTLIGGQLCALLVLVTLQQTLTTEELKAWGWRVPFVIGAIAALIALYLRKSLDETTTAATRQRKEAGTLRGLWEHKTAFMLVRHQRERFGPLERRAFSVREERRFAPHDDGRETPLGFAALARVRRMHIDAIRAAVDLRRAQPHQFGQRFFERRLADALFDAEQRFDRGGIGFVEVETLFHVHGANLGVSADAYRRAGGFPPLKCSEDAALVDRLIATGARIAWSAAPRVTTSARTVARVRGGFGDTLIS